MLIFRYLAKEVFVTLVALTIILLLIFMSNQFVHYLNRAASGQFPVMFILKLMMLEMPNLMGLLLPLGFYMSLMIAYGRLYAESEMTVLNACGYSQLSLLRHSLWMASGVGLFVLVVMLWLSPYIAIERNKVFQNAGVQTLIQTIVPGQFRATSGGSQIYYVDSMDRQQGIAGQVFIARWDSKASKAEWDVLWAEKAFIQEELKTHENYVILQNGRAYQGLPGRADYQVAEFHRYKARLPHPFAAKYDIRTAFTSTLWLKGEDRLARMAELQWRFSIPLMVLVLTLIAVPLSRVDPRSGKFAKIFPAILIFIIYANFLFISRGWVATGKIPLWVGMWWLHLVFALLGGLLMWRSRVKLS